MISKKILLSISTFFLLTNSIPSLAFAKEKIYFRGFYNGTYVGSNKISGNENIISGEFGEDLKGNRTIKDQRPWNSTEYKFGNAGVMALGYVNDNFSIEVEVLKSGNIVLKNNISLFEDLGHKQITKVGLKQKEQAQSSSARGKRSSSNIGGIIIEEIVLGNNQGEAVFRYSKGITIHSKNRYEDPAKKKGYLGKVYYFYDSSSPDAKEKIYVPSSKDNPLKENEVYDFLLFNDSKKWSQTFQRLNANNPEVINRKEVLTPSSSSDSSVLGPNSVNNNNFGLNDKSKTSDNNEISNTEAQVVSVDNNEDNSRVTKKNISLTDENKPNDNDEISNTGAQVVSTDDDEDASIVTKENTITVSNTVRVINKYNYPMFKNFKYSAAMVHVNYITPVGMIDLYSGLGFGVAKTNISGSDNKDKFSLALQGKVGLSFNIKNIAPYIGYRMLYIMPATHSFKVTDQHEFKDGILESSRVEQKGEIKIRSSYLLHNLEVGIMIPFNV